MLFQNIVFNIFIAFLYFLCFVLSCLVICLFVFVQCIMKAVREGLHGANELYWAVNTEATRVMRPHRTCINSLLQGKCKDQINVTQNHTYQQVELNQSVPGEIEGMLKILQKALHEVNCRNL